MRRRHHFGTAQATARGRAEALLNRNTSNDASFVCAVVTPESPKRQRMMCVIMHARPPHIRYVSIGHQSIRIRPG